MVTPLIEPINDEETERRVARASTLRDLAEILTEAYVEDGARVKVTIEVADRHWATLAADFGPLDVVDSRLADAIVPDSNLTITFERGE